MPDQSARNDATSTYTTTSSAEFAAALESFEQSIIYGHSSTSTALSKEMFLSLVSDSRPCKVLRAFKNKFCDNLAASAYLKQSLGMGKSRDTWINWLEELLDSGEITGQVNQEAEPFDHPSAFLSFIHKTAKYIAPEHVGGRNDPSFLGITKRSVLRNAGLVLLTVINNLQDDPKAGYFANVLGGRPVVTWIELERRAQDYQQKKKDKIIRTRCGPRAGRTHKKWKANKRRDRICEEKLLAGPDESGEDREYTLPLYSLYDGKMTSGVEPLPPYLPPYSPRRDEHSSERIDQEA